MRSYLTTDELFYISNSLYNLSMQIDILNLIVRTVPRDKRTRNVLIFEIISKFCQLVEASGAHINAFQKSNKSESKTEEVLNYLSIYTIKNISNDYKSVIFGCKKTDSLFDKIKSA